MNSISFIEKDEFELPPLPFHQKGDKAVPVFMILDGKEYFIISRTTEKRAYYYDTESIKLNLIENEGKYFKFYGHFANPFELVKLAAEKKCSFESNGKDGRVFNDIPTLFSDCRDEPRYGEGFIDFAGNIREVSAAFRYRIYDVAMVEALKNAIRTEIQ